MGAGQAALIARLAGRSRQITRFLADESGAARVPNSSALRAAAAALRNRNALRGITTVARTRIVWGRGIQQQGRPWEDALDATGEHGRRLVSNFPAIDFFDFRTGAATSAKTIDLGAHTYTTRPSTIHGTLKRYVDQLDRFDGADRGYEELIESKRLILAIPEGATERQMGEIARTMEHARERGIEMRVFVAP
jgi:filamentous hemagglutinin